MMFSFILWRHFAHAVFYNESHHSKKHDTEWTRTINLQINSLLRSLLRHCVKGESSTLSVYLFLGNETHQTISKE